MFSAYRRQCTIMAAHAGSRSARPIPSASPPTSIKCGSGYDGLCAKKIVKERSSCRRAKSQHQRGGYGNECPQHPDPQDRLAPPGPLAAHTFAARVRKTGPRTVMRSAG